MTATLAPARPAIDTRTASPPPSYAHAHWYFLAALLVIVAGFWPTFFRPMGSGSVHANLHGITSTLWYVVLMSQSWMMSRGIVTWHRRLGFAMVFALMPALCVTALANTRVMLTASAVIPPPARPMIAFIDFQLVSQLIVFVILGLRNRRRDPLAHKRYMALTAPVGFPPALARLYHNIGFEPLGPINGPLVTTGVLLIVMIISDRQRGESRRAAPIMLAWNVLIMLLIGPLAFSPPWQAFCRWFAA